MDASLRRLLGPLLESIHSPEVRASPIAFRARVLACLADALGADSALYTPLVPVHDDMRPSGPPALLNKEAYMHRYEQHVRDQSAYRPTLMLLRRGAEANGGVCIDTDVVDRSARSHSPFYAEVSRPQQIRQQLFAVVQVGDRACGTIFLCRHGRGRDYRSAQRIALAHVLPWIASAQWATELLAGRSEPSTRLADTLSSREAEVAELVGRGLRNQEIAAVLGTSTLTVRNQLVQIFRKLEVASRSELAAVVTRARV